MTGATLRASIPRLSCGAEAARVLRFGLAGVLNTLAGFGVILLLQGGLGVPPGWANAGGFLAGWVVSFTLARLFVFASRDPVGRSLARYGLAVAVSFALNQVVLAGAGWLLHAERPWMAQAAGVATYSVVLFLVCRLWVFRPSEVDDRRRAPATPPPLR